MAQYLGPAFQQALSASAVPYSGGLLYIYEPGTTTPIALFTDEDMLTPAANPMVADSSGSFTPVFLAETSVKLVLQTSTGSTVRTIDPVYTVGVSNVLSADDVAYSNGDSGLAANNVQDALDEIVDLQGLSQSWTSASDGPIATGTSTNAGAAAGPLVEMYRNSASPANSDIIGGRRDTGNNAAGSKVTYTQDHTVITDTTNGSEDAKRVIQTMVSGALADRVHFGGGIWGDGATGGDPGTGKANFTEIQQNGAAVRPLVLGTLVATTSGTTVDFTSIPSWARRVTIFLNGVSVNGSAEMLIQIGDGGGIENTGYLGAATNVTDSATAVDNYTAGFGITGSVDAATVLHGSIVLSLIDPANNTWSAMAVNARSNTDRMGFGAGTKSLSATLDRVRITTVAGTATFDAGSANISYE